MKKRLNPKLIIEKIISRLRSQSFSLRYLVLDILLILVITTLSYNIIKAYQDGSRNLGRLKIEEERLLKLQSENERLTEEENYYKSIEFRKAYARESLNLTNQGETLYMVVRDEPTTEDDSNKVEYFNTENIKPHEQWRLLIFGR
jgi:cell division protein FtsB